MTVTVRSIKCYPGLERSKVEVSANLQGDTFFILYVKRGFFWKELGRFGSREKLENFARRYSLYHNKPVEIVINT